MIFNRVYTNNLLVFCFFTLNLKFYKKDMMDAICFVGHKPLCLGHCESWNGCQSLDAALWGRTGKKWTHILLWELAFFLCSVFSSVIICRCGGYTMITLSWKVGFKLVFTCSYVRLTLQHVAHMGQDIFCYLQLHCAFYKKRFYVRNFHPIIMWDY